MSVPVERVVVLDSGAVKLELYKREHFCPDTTAAAICIASVIDGGEPTDHSA